jgi:alkanesulfonate monooxygenase SsuD/methylene tetrahydromethanopterin reductase-like flavin-dependent oxidoreductase (luciferase family)
MQFGVSFVPDADPATKSAEQYYAEVLRLSRIADDAGLTWVKMTEHYLHPYGGYSPSPLTFLAAVAVQTRSIRLMTGGVIPVFHHPVQLASHVAMVDALSGGRVDLGFARGFLPYEHETFGVPMDESHERFEASADAVVRLLSEEKVTEDTPYFSFRDATILPRPTQQPHPPIWAAAVRNPRSFQRYGERGYGLLMTPVITPIDDVVAQVKLYRDAYRAAGHQGEPPVVASVPVFVADTDADAYEVGDALLARYFDVWVSAAESWNDVRSDAFPTYTGLGKTLRLLPASGWRERGTGIFGSPAQVADQIRAFHERTGITGLIPQVDFGGVSGDVAERSLRLFIDKVIPEVVSL